MTLRPSRVVEQQIGIQFFVQKTAKKKGKGPGYHKPHYGRPGEIGGSRPRSAGAAVPAKRKPLTELLRWGYAKTEPLSRKQSGVEISHLVEFEDGTKALHKLNTVGFAQSELMAYEFSESIGWEIVPETILVEDEENVSLQRWVEGAPLGMRQLRPGEKAFRKDPRVIIMDTLLQNDDRHGGNILIGIDGKQWAIDNNLALPLRSGEYGPLRLQRLEMAVWEGQSGLINAAKDVRRWAKTPAYRKYIAKLKKRMGDSIAAQFEYNVKDLADWSETAE